MLVHPLSRGALGRLRPRHTGLVRAGTDHVLVLDGVPILVPDPVGWCARHRDSIVACVATFGGDVTAVIALVDGLIAEAPRVAQGPFVDDFTPEEAADRPPPALVDGPLQDLLDDGTTPLRWLLSSVPAAPVIVELGPGGGGLSALLSARARRRLLALDLSMRSVLLARRAAGPRATAAVADVTALPLADASVDVIVAENVVDVVDDADALIAGVHRALPKGGVFALTTPDPELGGDGDDVEQRLRDAGFAIEATTDGLRWPRIHGRRHVELWTCRGVVARRR